SDRLLKKATNIESVVFQKLSPDGTPSQNYKAKVRSFFMNLRDKNNPKLREAVVDGDVPVEEFCEYTTQDMASAEAKARDRALHEENMFAAKGAEEQQAETDMFKCGKCKGRKTRYYQMQTRSADEPMTTFVTCINCGNSYFSTSSPSYSSRDTMDPQTPFGPSSLPNQPQPPLPPRTNAHYQSQHQQRRNQVIDEQQTGGHQPSHPDGLTSDPPADLEQHCLLFPTYATTHSRSGSKDPLDWNIRVRGWAFSKRSNRRKRLVMSMARKLAGVTKDNKVYDTLESRFGMFLASNTQGARFSIQCVGLAKTTQMELAGDPTSHDPTVNELMSELKTPEGARAAEEAAQDKAFLRKSLEEDRGGILQMSSNPPSPLVKSKQVIENAMDFHKQEQRNRSQTPVDNQQQQRRGQNIQVQNAEQLKYFPPGGAPLTKFTSPESEVTLSDRWSKGAAFAKGVYRKYKPVVMAQISSSNNSVDSLRPHPDQHQQQQQSGSSTRTSSSLSDYSKDESTDLYTTSRCVSGPPGTSRNDSVDTVLSQTITHYEDLGHGSFPTVQISSKPGGHFDGTLRVSLDEVDINRQEEGGGHRRFLKLHAYHPDMTEHCHGIVNLIDPEGISIISDIDDTIKETNVVAGTRIILRNTFLKDMRDVPGMASVYNRWWKRGAAVHYVSNSPWQLIPSLLDFFHTHKFPPGSAHLRLHEGVLKTYYMTPGEHKRRCIKEIMTDFPDRKFILVGDSGEIDMEIYTEIALAHPSQVFKIFIRDISTARLKEEATKAPAPRVTSFTSMLPKAPITAVTTGFGFFSRQSNQASGSTMENKQGSASSEPWDHKQEQLLENFYNVDKDSGSSFSLSQSSSRDQYASPSPAPSTAIASSRQSGYPFPKTDKSGNTVNADDPLIDVSLDDQPANTEGALGSGSPDSGRESPTPGALPSPQVPVAKNPYEIWMDRVEACEMKLPSGMLTFFESTDILEQDILVNALFDQYGTSSPTSPGSEYGQESSDSSDDDHHDLHLHHLHHHRGLQRQDSVNKDSSSGSSNASSGRNTPIPSQA
ncbi:hypothetical protein BGZ74_007566, partial [Mortierella antarctica]